MTDLNLKIKRITLAAEARGIKTNSNRIRRKMRRLLSIVRAAVVAGTEEAAALKHGKSILRCIKRAGSLDDHRLKEVRPEARAMHLACAFLRGRAYERIEAVTHWPVTDEKFAPIWKALWERVRYHVTKHMPAEGSGASLQRLAEWEDGARAYARSKEAQAPSLEAARAGSRARVWDFAIIIHH